MSFVQNQNISPRDQSTADIRSTHEETSLFYGASVGSIAGAVERALRNEEGFSYISRPLDPYVRVGIEQWLESRDTGGSIFKEININHGNLDSQAEILLREFKEEGLRDFLAVELVRHIIGSAQEYMEATKTGDVRIFINSQEPGQQTFFHLDQPASGGKRIIRGHEVLSGDGGFFMCPKFYSSYSSLLKSC